MSDLEIVEKKKADMTLKAMADVYAPALGKAAEVHDADRQRRKAIDLRELANVWEEIGRLMGAEIDAAKNASLRS
jgi:hypothetical protein